MVTLGTSYLALCCILIIAYFLKKDNVIIWRVYYKLRITINRYFVLLKVEVLNLKKNISENKQQQYTGGVFLA